MEVKEGGMVIVKGDFIENGGLKIVNSTTKEEKKVPLTEELLKEKVEHIKSRIDNGRLWFPVCKYMMIEKLVPEGDFEKAAEILKRLFPEITINTKDLATLNVLSFRKKPEEWDENDSPIKDRTTFFKYKNIAELLFDM